MTSAFVGRRLVWVRRHELRFLSKDAAETLEDVFRTDARLQRRFAVSESDPAATGTAVRVKKFFQKNKPPPKPAPPQPKKEWLLRRQPEPEEVTEKPDEFPRAGNIEEERKWLDFGDYTEPGRQPLITHTPEFRRIAKDIEHEMDRGGSERQRGVPRMRVNASFTQRQPSSATKHLYFEGGSRKGFPVEGLLAGGSGGNTRGNSYEGVDAYFERMSGGPLQDRQSVNQDGFADIMSAMKANMHRDPLTHETSHLGTSSRVTERGLVPEQSIAEIQLQRPKLQTVSQVDDDKAHSERVYGQLVMEELSEETLSPVEGASADYDYNPRRPRWLDPPDGDSVGAVPQREFNDFTPQKAPQDFWNESSATEFEDPGQDPAKPNRHKLYGQEYWVAKPMLMEKYDYGEESTSYEATNDTHLSLDPEIPPHFVERDVRVHQLSIPESRTCEDFFDLSEELDQPPESEKLYSMSASDGSYMNEVAFERQRVVVDGKVLNGYTVPRDADGDSDEMHEDVKDWLYDTPTPRDDGYSHLFAVARTSSELDATNVVQQKDGYGKIEKFLGSYRVPVPSRERVEEITHLEGLQDETPCDIVGDTHIEEMPASERYYEGVDTRSLHTLMEAECRYHDMFSDEKSEHMPDINFGQSERLSMLDRLNTGATPETRPVNQLLQSPARSDFDPWMLRELQKCLGDGQVYGDVFQLICQPKMLEIAFSSLRRRRPGSVPKALESNFFELASRILGSGDIAPSTAIGPQKPPKEAGKGARSTRIPSHPRTHPYRS